MQIRGLCGLAMPDLKKLAHGLTGMEIVNTNFGIDYSEINELEKRALRGLIYRRCILSGSAAAGAAGGSDGSELSPSRVISMLVEYYMIRNPDLIVEVCLELAER